MPTIQQLNHRRAGCDPAETRRLRALYEGGRLFKAHLDEFLPQRPMESPDRHTLRKQEAVYRNYLGPIIDFFTSLLFTSKPVAKAKVGKDVVEEPGDYYEAFRKDCDRGGTDIDALFKRLLTDALVAGVSWVRIGHPVAESDPRNLAEFERSGIGDSWIRQVDNEDVLDWDYDDSGVLEWAVVHSAKSKRISLSDTSNWITETWEHFLPDRIEIYRISYAQNKRPEANTEVPLVETIPHRYGVVPLYRVELPPGLWVANRLETPQLGHFRLSNAQTWGMTATCYAMSVVKVNDPERFKQTMGAGYGFMIKPDEDVEWTAPPIGPFEALGTEIKAHKDEIYRIVSSLAMGVDNNAAAVGRSAESKQSDAEATRVVLLAYARVIKEAIERIYDTISRARGDKYTWTISGLDDFAAKDLSGLVDVLEKIDKFGGVPSRTFQIQMMRRLTESMLPDLDEKTKQTIRDELESGIADQSAAARDAKVLKQLSAVRDKVEVPNQDPPSKDPTGSKKPAPRSPAAKQ